MSLVGGANVIQQYLAAGVVDELQLNVVPVVLGEGARLFDNIAGADINLQFVQGSRRRASPTSRTAS